MWRPNRSETTVTESNVTPDSRSSIPANIKKPSAASFVGDPEAAGEVIFAPESLIQVLSAGALASFRSLKTITVPACVEVIGEGCFAEMPLLRRVEFEAGSKLRVLKSRAFFKCGAHWDEIRQRIQALPHFSSRYTPISVAADIHSFVNSLGNPPASSEDILIPASVETLGDECFAYSTFARAVRFEAGSKLRSLSSGAFFQALIQWIEIPGSVKVVAENCFGRCVMLSHVTFGTSSLLRAIKGHALWFSGIQSIRIPQGVDAIGGSCFERCESLSTVEFPPNCRVRYLETYTFCDCQSLTSICIPASIESIGVSCFCDCGKLRSLTFESRSALSTIEKQAFYDCEILGPSIQIPSSLAVVAELCFGACPSLSAITFEANSALRELRPLAFGGRGLKSFCMPASMKVVDWLCFLRCDKAIEVTFESPCRVREILNFDPGTRRSFSVPDSVERLTVTASAERGFVWNFGRHSRFQYLRFSLGTHRKSEFMRFSESLIKAIRDDIEWNNTWVSGVADSDWPVLRLSHRHFPFNN
jgi:hypothetical protein